MRVTVRHETRYTYGRAALSALQLLRLTPRSHDSQFVRRWRVEVDSDARLDKSEDAYGNLTHLVFLEGPITHVSILVEGEVQTTSANGLVRGTLERQSERLFLRETALTRVSPAIRMLAREAAASEGGDLLAAMHRLNQDLFRGMSFQVGTTTSATTAAQAFEAKSGVCQDFAHVLIAAARTLGLPARYVSGYYVRSDRASQEAGHAWAEVHVPRLGWLGFDPAHGLCVTEQHVRTAVGADYGEAAPVRGAQIGGEDEALSVAIQVHQGQAIVEA